MTTSADRRPDPVVGIYHPQHAEVASLLATTIPLDRLQVCASADLDPGWLAGVDVLLAKRYKGRAFPRDLILTAPALQWLHLASAGVDYILPLERTHPVVTSSKGLHGQPIAEYVVATLLEWRLELAELREDQRRRQWTRRSRSAPLHGQTMAILGLGHVGACVAARASAFGMRIVGTRHTGRPVAGVDRVYGPEDTARVLGTADVVVVTLPLTDRTRHLLDRRMLSKLKPGAFLVVVSRGGIVDEGALVDEIRGGRVAAAALDVFENEPLPADSPLWSVPNLLVTPHISGALANPAVAESRLFLDNLERWMDARSLLNVVDPASGY